MKSLIKNIAQDIADEKGFLLINSITRGSNKKPSFEIFVDSKNGISAKDCADFSREVKDKLESTDIGQLDYKLVVSSPGIDEPIRYLEQYHKHIDREFKLSFSNNDDILSIETKLLRIEGDELTFSYKNDELKIDFNKIKKAKVKFSF